jgi:hypothetical protein
VAFQRANNYWFEDHEGRLRGTIRLLAGGAARGELAIDDLVSNKLEVRPGDLGLVVSAAVRLMADGDEVLVVAVPRVNAIHAWRPSRSTVSVWSSRRGTPSVGPAWSAGRWKPTTCGPCTALPTSCLDRASHVAPPPRLAFFDGSTEISVCAHRDRSTRAGDPPPRGRSRLEPRGSAGR